ncbi:MAG: transposase [Bacilli bacterium]|jgi:transposase-like protein
MRLSTAQNQFYDQYEKLLKKFDEQAKLLKEQNDNVKELNQTIKTLNEKLAEAHLEIERLKNQINKDSSNSSKPSSSNGFKKITNNREKSKNKKGAQVGHEGKTLSPKYIEKLIADGQVDEVKTIEIGKTNYNKDMEPIIKYTYDLEIKRIVTKTLYYPNTELKVPKGKPVSYGENIKTIACLLNANYLSYDGITEMFNHLTNNTINVSKATVLSWNKTLSNNLTPQMENIKGKLLNSLVLNVDESPIKIDGQQHYIHTVSNGFYTLQYVTKHRSKDDVDAFGFLKQYKGIIVHDHYKLYYNYGSDNAECNVHILRYLNGVTEFTTHSWSKELKELLLEMKERKEELISFKKYKIDITEFNGLREKYLNILKKGKQERLDDLKTNAYKDEELKLLNRLIKYEHNHLLFLNKFIVPFSNNRAESDLRKIKIKQKIGKFRSGTGADIYAIIRSCASTYSKNDINLFDAFKNALNNNPIII